MFFSCFQVIRNTFSFLVKIPSRAQKKKKKNFFFFFFQTFEKPKFQILIRNRIFSFLMRTRNSGSFRRFRENLDEKDFLEFSLEHFTFG